MFSGRVAGFEAFPEFDGGIPMQVDFEDGDVSRGDLNFTEILWGCEAYLEVGIQVWPLEAPWAARATPSCNPPRHVPSESANGQPLLRSLAFPALLRPILSTSLTGVRKIRSSESTADAACAFKASIFISRCQPSKKAAGSSGRGSLSTLNSTENCSGALPPRGKFYVWFLFVDPSALI